MNKRENYLLLAEDNPDDVELTLLAFKKNNFANEIKVVKDGEEAIHFLDEDKPDGISKYGLPELIFTRFKAF